jgi:hypothetical protein
MSRWLTDLCGEQVERRGGYGRGVAPCAVCELVVDKRSSARAQLVFASMTSTHSRGGRWSPQSVLFETVGVGASLGGELGRRSTISRKKKE